MYTYSFERLEAWQKARVFYKDISDIAKTFPRIEIFGLRSQITRAATSICSNIAEGSSRASAKDQAHFYQIAYSSLMEVLCQLILATDQSYISPELLQSKRVQLNDLACCITRLRAAALKRCEK